MKWIIWNDEENNISVAVVEFIFMYVINSNRRFLSAGSSKLTSAPVVKIRMFSLFFFLVLVVLSAVHVLKMFSGAICL